MSFFNGILLAQVHTSGANVTELGIYDWGSLAAYFLILLGIAWWVIRQKTDTSQDYFLAGRKAGWLIIGSSLFASNIGSEHLVGLASTGANDGMAMAHYELHAWCLLVLGWVMVPFYERSCVYTMPEFLERRYSSSARWFLSVMSLIAYVMTKISVTLFAGGIVFKALFPIEVIPGISNFWVGAVGMVVITGLYTVLGGLRAVLYTELMQTFVLLGGAIAVLVCGLIQIGGWDELKKTVHGTDRIVGYKVLLEPGGEDAAGGVVIPKLLKDKEGKDIVIARPKMKDAEKKQDAEQKTDAEKKKDAEIKKRFIRLADVTQEDAKEAKLAEKMDAEQYAVLFGGGLATAEELKSFIQPEMREKTDHFNLWKPNSHPDFPWFGLLFGAPIVGMWYWCTDQYIVQRTLAAKNQREARRGTIFGAYLKLTPVFLFIVPGMIAYGLAVQGKINGEVLFEAELAFPLLVKEVLPIGVKGLVVGGLLAALMSSLASVYNSCSTLFTMDIYVKLRPNSSETHLVWVGRVATGIIVFLGLLWIPMIKYIPLTLYGYLQSVQSYIAPPIFAVFFLGVFSRRINAYGCMTGLIGGFVLGMTRLALEIVNRITPFTDGTFLKWFATTSYTFIGIYLTVACCILIIGVSLLTPKPREEQIIGLTYGTATEEQKRETRDSWSWVDVALTAGLVAIILGVYIYFSPLGM